MVPAIAITSRERANKTQRLRLRYQGQEILVQDGRANITMGRAEENDLVVKGNLISRLHARVEFNRNKFMLIDQSTNGTFVLGKDGEEAFVRRDSMQIRGEGLIGLGKAPGQQLLAGDPLRLRGVSALPARHRLPRARRAAPPARGLRTPRGSARPPRIPSASARRDREQLLERGRRRCRAPRYPGPAGRGKIADGGLARIRASPCSDR